MAEISPEVDFRMIASEPDADGLVWYKLPCAPFDLYGFISTDPYRRVPADVAENTNPGVKRNATHTAGGRVRFSTDSTRIGIRTKMPYMTKFAHMALIGSSAFDLYADTETGSRFFRCFKPTVDSTDGFTLTEKVPAPKKVNYFTLNFPLYSPVDVLEIGLDAGSYVGEGRKYSPLAPIVYYGSSITQGACASRPGLCYESIVTRRLNIDHINLGFSGNAKAELPIVEWMATLNMSVFVSDYDHNAPSAAYLKDTHCRMYQIIREKNPDIPYIMLTAPDFFAIENGRANRRAIIEDTYRYACAQGDKNVWYVDGEGIFRGYEEDSCSVDGTHPNDLGFMKMADCVERILVRALRKTKVEG